MREQDIRPEHLIQEYLRLTKKDAEALKANNFSWQERSFCLFCASQDLVIEFEKHDFRYCRCANCGSLFANPRPSVEALSDFYCQSESSEFWAKKFLPAVEKSRNTLTAQKAGLIKNIISKRKLLIRSVVDVGGGNGTMLEEINNSLGGQLKTAAVEPSIAQREILRNKGIESFSSAHHCTLKYDLVVSFEVLEHVQDPQSFLEECKSLCDDGGTLILSTLTIDGLDLKVLGKDSKAISPPHHLNFPSIKGLEAIVSRSGFENCEIFTPGQLDIDIFWNAYLKADTKEETLGDRFTQMILGSTELRKQLQQLISQNNMSSHCWIIATNG